MSGNVTRGRPKGVGKVDRRDPSVGNVIRRARIDLGMGLADVAEKIGGACSIQFISNIEHGRAPLPMDLVAVFSYTLGIPVKKLATAALHSTNSYQKYVKLVA